MKSLLNPFRAAVFVIAIYYLLKFEFFCFDWFGIKAIIFLGEIKEKINAILFWVLFVLFGIALLVILWYLFKYTSFFIMAFLARICPYRGFASWSTGILSIIYSCVFLYGYWYLGRHSLSFRNFVFGLILTSAAIQLCISLVKGVIVSYEIEDKANLVFKSN